MPRRKVFSYWRERVQKLADKENDEHISTAEWAECLNEIYGDLYNIVSDGADAYFQSTQTYVVDGSASYDEPDDHLSTICIERVDSAGQRHPLNKLLAQERHMFGTFTGDATAYSLIDNQLFLYPRPSSGTYELLYIAQPPDLTTYSDTDLLDVVNVYGEQFLVYGVAALALSKSESDVRFMLSRQKRAEDKLMEWAAQRAFHDPQRHFVDESVTGPTYRRRLPPP